MAEPPRWLDFSLLQDSPLYQQLKVRGGFDGAFSLPLRDPETFFKLLGFMLALHYTKKYQEIDVFLDRSGWKDRVRRFADTYSAIPENYPVNGDWWEQMGSAFKRHVFMEFRAIGKQSLCERVAAGEGNVRNDTRFVQKLVEELKLCIVWMERQGEENTLTHTFSSNLTNDPGFLVYLLEENDRLCLLYHPQFQGQQTHGQHPHYILLGRTQPFQLEGAGNPSLSREISINPRTLEKVLTDTLMAIVLKTSESQSFPESTTPDFKALLEVVNKLKSKAGETDMNLDTAARVAALRPNAKSLPRQHDLAHCQSFQNGGEMKHACHSFHARCLKIYLSECLSQQQQPKCPMCHQPFAQQFIENEYPELARTLDLQRQRIVRAATTHPVGSIQFSQFSTLNTVTCNVCRRTEIMWSNSHGRCACRECVRKSLAVSLNCPWCGGGLTEDDVAKCLA